MNIFVLDEDPILAARMHCDVHVVKMILESTQILCAVWHRHGWTFDGIYKPTHKNHPCVRWVGDSVEAYRWVHELLRALLDEYSRRYGKTHKCAALYDQLDALPDDAEDSLPMMFGGGTPEFVFCGPETLETTSIVASYRRYYRAKNKTMRRAMKWTNREAPAWFTEGVW